MTSDLAPVYGPRTELAAGINRGTVEELRTFYAKRLAELDGIVTGCVRCDHKSGTRCKKFGAEVPADYTGNDCPEWAFDGIPW